MGSISSHIVTAFQHAVHELIVSIFDLLIYFAIIILALIVGKLFAMVIKSFFRCGSRLAPVPKRALGNAFKAVPTKYHTLP
ncbi:E protein [Pebjah virus]|uniref:E protein n=1 Tax=Pebjah virus TaxID=1658615 RepID=A0A0G2UPU7_9NIDO|nr:E protein [Pebjah virus]AKI29931.1 E protein [Pebjah virus]AKI29946.1 E protein [Pebjah virus]AKI29961.1 E protein [Pebjah virus]